MEYLNFCLRSNGEGLLGNYVRVCRTHLNALTGSAPRAQQVVDPSWKIVARDFEAKEGGLAWFSRRNATPKRACIIRVRHCPPRMERQREREREREKREEGVNRIENSRPVSDSSPTGHAVTNPDRKIAESLMKDRSFLLFTKNPTVTHFSSRFCSYRCTVLFISQLQRRFPPSRSFYPILVGRCRISKS